MGCYETKFDLYEEGTLISANKKAGLLSQSKSVSRQIGYKSAKTNQRVKKNIILHFIDD